jgi:hypothetical protein
MVRKLPFGFEMKIPLVGVPWRLSSKAIWPSSFIETRDEGPLKRPSERRKRVSKVPAREPTTRPWSPSSSSGTIATWPRVFTEWSATRNSAMKAPPGGLMVWAMGVSRPPRPRKTPWRRWRCSTVPQSSRVESRRRLPWKATSPSSLIDGSEKRPVKPLSQKVGWSGRACVSATTTGASPAPRLVTILVRPRASSRTVTATVPRVLSAGQRTALRPSRWLSSRVVNR